MAYLFLHMYSSVTFLYWYYCKSPVTTRKLRVIFIFLLFFILNPLLLSLLSGCRRSCLHHVWVFQLSCPAEQPSSLTVAGRGQRFLAGPVTEFLQLIPVTEYSYSMLLLNIEIGFMGLFRLSG